MLLWRVVSATIILALLLALLYLDLHFSPVRQGQTASGVWLIPLLLATVTLAAAELLDLLAIHDLRPRAWTVYAGTWMVVLAACAPLAWPLLGREYPVDCPLGRAGWPLAAMFASLVVVVVTEMRAYHQPGQALIRVALSVFAITYLGLLASYLAQLRLLLEHRWGLAALLSLLFVVKMSDIGAYGVGRLLGRRKVFPRLSPGKTVEGCVGGLLAAVVAAWVFATWLLPLLVEGISVPGGPTPGAGGLPAGQSVWAWLGYGLLLGVFGMAGDLTVSLLKRDVGRKDSGRWLPGLGGALDVLDSVLLAAPPAFLCFAAGLVGP